MIFHEAKTKGIKKQFKELETIMKQLGFVRWSWDYEKATYDLKYTADGVDYYLRLRGTVVNDKALEHPQAILEMGTPVFVRHFFPHGLDDSVEVPPALESQVKEKLAELEKALSA
ncbi:YugN family protein [Thermoflavimicrobium dichotomicum]|uniref:YugN-like family protein n=1 Tax=Thermoflavimicrobium dichotomicum TaxID=46223 RepID=A0A1I3MPQ4_9BACL|nr:YugN family protein [Thermoflavimicrobium dichotomicum]SFI98676.1 YugN-like family protein [Thermoflavimicrobium dichotomicum]